MTAAPQPTRAQLLRRIRKLEHENDMLRRFRTLDHQYFNGAAMRAVESEWRIEEAMAILRGEDLDAET